MTQATSLPVADHAARFLAGVSGFTSDSRRVERGMGFAAYPGHASDGRAYIPQAIERGAAAVLWEQNGFAWRPEWSARNLAVDGLRSRISEIAAAFYGRPSQDVWMVGVTGTNGKTSCATWIAQCLDQIRGRTALYGTLGNGWVGSLVESANTTPDAIELQRLLAEAKRSGAKNAVMEVSSHGLDQGRVTAVAYDIAVFTNLTRDHLDYHGSMEAYAEAKAKLFAWPGLRTAVINADDAFGAELIRRRRAAGQAVTTYSLKPGADVVAHHLELSPQGVRFSLAAGGTEARVSAVIAGTYNASNLLAVAGTLLASDVPLQQTAELLSVLKPVLGRMQTLGGGDKPLVVVDYAHTPDALEKVLSALRPNVAPGGRLLCVFGCGGDRDPGKRPQMATVSAKLSDFTIVTSDNPRTEDPRLIIDAILKGTHGAPHSVEVDRRQAIARAIGMAKRGDVVLLAGKGHEDYQIIGTAKLPFSDLVEAQHALEQHA